MKDPDNTPETTNVGTVVVIEPKSKKKKRICLFSQGCENKVKIIIFLRFHSPCHNMPHRL